MADDIRLPKGINDSDLIRDPSGREGHWYHPGTQQTFNMGFGWRPAGSPKATAERQPARPSPAEQLTGKRVAILEGPYKGSHGGITEAAQGADGVVGALVVVDGIGKEIPFDKFDGCLRLLTAEEIAADEKTLKERGNASA